MRIKNDKLRLRLGGGLVIFGIVMLVVAFMRIAR